MVGWNVQVYAKLPFFDAVYVQDCPAAIDCELNVPSFDVAVCGNGSLFTHTIVSPAVTMSAEGSNFDPSIVTVCVVALAVAAPPARHVPDAATVNAATSNSQRRESRWITIAGSQRLPA